MTEFKNIYDEKILDVSQTNNEVFMDYLTNVNSSFYGGKNSVYSNSIEQVQKEKLTMIKEMLSLHGANRNNRFQICEFMVLYLHAIGRTHIHNINKLEKTLQEEYERFKREKKYVHENAIYVKDELNHINQIIEDFVFD
jgi:hypothetical protein